LHAALAPRCLALMLCCCQLINNTTLRLIFSLFLRRHYFAIDYCYYAYFDAFMIIDALLIFYLLLRFHFAIFWCRCFSLMSMVYIIDIWFSSLLLYYFATAMLSFFFFLSPFLRNIISSLLLDIFLLHFHIAIFSSLPLLLHAIFFAIIYASIFFLCRRHWWYCFIDYDYAIIAITPFHFTLTFSSFHFPDISLLLIDFRHFLMMPPMIIFIFLHFLLHY